MWTLLMSLVVPRGDAVYTEIKNINPSNAETVMLRQKKVNAMYADGLVPCIARPSVAMVLVM